MLERWNPTPGADGEQADQEAAKGGMLAPTSLQEFEMRDRVALHRAATVDGCAERIFRPNPKLSGTPWYDALEHIVDVDFEYVVDGQIKNLYGPREQTAPSSEKAERNGLADRITAHVTLARGDARRTIELPTDFLVLEEYENDPRTAGVLVTTDCEQGLEELQELLENALFEPGDDEEDDSIETQLHDFQEWAHEAVCKLMLDAQTAEVEIIRYAVRTHVMRKLPKDGITQIRTRGDDVEVELLPEEHAESSDGG